MQAKRPKPKQLWSDNDRASMLAQSGVSLDQVRPDHENGIVKPAKKQAWNTQDAVAAVNRWTGVHNHKLNSALGEAETDRSRVERSLWILEQLVKGRARLRTLGDGDGDAIAAELDRQAPVGPHRCSAAQVVGLTGHTDPSSRGVVLTPLE